ncbi:hypothetical protein QAD02_018189 [Eretmocerus hayati]|uniref:Uncharacterized protein n=1 Tax=Eretmocerus hayati TaxID=131215 RepID=A0ACC2PFZ6_9HYME|nr:hypothetical protein QAD02_018189 [Eretmocerus hayati]
MRDNMFESCEDIEPRKMPTQTPNFHSRPCPMVPEVSLIMDKSQKASKVEDSVPNALQSYRLNSIGNLTPKPSESYAAWKAKQYPQSVLKQNTSPAQQGHQSSQNHAIPTNDDHPQNSNKACDSCNCHNSNCKSQKPTEDMPPGDANVRSCPDDQYLHNQHLDRTVLNDDSHHYSTNRHTHQSNAASDANGRYSPIERRRFDHSHSEKPYNFSQQPRIQRSHSYNNTDSHFQKYPPREYDYELRHARSLPPHYQGVEHCHPHQGCCTINQSNSNTETETVKNLLQVITSQNDQIKNLQKQIERLLKLHEYNLRERSKCKCQSNGHYHHSTQLHDTTQNKNLSNIQNNIMKDKEQCFSEPNYQEEKNKKTVLEQKVSIGVMTSFELKVQNNPMVLNDTDTNQKSTQERKIASSETSNIIKNLVNNTGEMIRRKPNYYNYTPLENISEGSERDMSLLRHNYTGPDSTKQCIEAHGTPDVQDQHEMNDQRYDTVNQNDVQKDMGVDNYDIDQRNGRFAGDLEYGFKEPVYENMQDSNDRRNLFDYDLPYHNVCSSPIEQIRDERPNEIDAEPLLPDITQLKKTKCENLADDCLSLSSSELDVEDPSPPSPEPSIHLDMLDIQEFSSEGGSLPPQQPNKVGWTFYDNVVDQVNQILHNTPSNVDQRHNLPDGMKNNYNGNYEKDMIMDTVRAATLEQLTKLGISFSDNIEHRAPNYNKRVVFDTSYYPKQGPETHMAATTSASIETNTSMHMKALAMKYLNEEQLTDFTGQKSRPHMMKQIPNNVQSSNMSFATMHYLQRYHLLPGPNPAMAKDAPREDYRGPAINERLMRRAVDRRDPSPHKHVPVSNTNKVNYPSKILDISTLKQQPKLL